MNSALNQQLADARQADLRRRADRNWLALAAIRPNRESMSTPASRIAALLLHLRRIRRTRLHVIGEDTDSVGTRSRMLRRSRKHRVA